MNLKGKKIALIGGAGFIGHHLALKLISYGAEVTILDAFSVNNLLNQFEKRILSPNEELYAAFLKERVNLLLTNNVEIKIADFSDRYEAAKSITENYDVIYLLAAVSHASRSNTDPSYAVTNSLLPLINVLSEVMNHRHTRLVFLSSSTVYGHFEQEIVTEEDSCKPFGVYATIKYCGELLLTELGNQIDFNFSVVRPSALYGERCISRRVSQIFLENAAAGVESKFFGDKEEKLDFTYIQDLVQGLILAGTKNEARGEIFNITYGNARKVITLIDILKNTFNNAEVKIEPRNQATPIRGTLSNEKARKLLGFEPEFNLELGYERYINWYQTFLQNHNVDLSVQAQVHE